MKPRKSEGVRTALQGVVLAVLTYALLPHNIGALGGLAVAAYFGFKAWRLLHSPSPTKLRLKKTTPLNSKMHSDRFYASQLPGNPSSGRAIPPPSSRMPHSAPRWIPAGESVAVAGYDISAGLVYVGCGLLGAHGEADPALIDPRKPVGRTPGTPGPRLTDYWPSYALLTQEARAGYLAWLANGRNSEAVDPGFLFLFFYGLERRVLLDGVKNGGSREEWPAIKAELRRLITRYGAQAPSSVPYFKSLLEFMEMASAKEKSYLGEFPIVSEQLEMSYCLRLALGQTAVDQVPVPPKLAFAWQAAHPAIIHRTAVSRCPDEFAALFPSKYAEMYGDGLQLADSGPRLQLVYRPASLAFGQGEEFVLRFGGVNDVAMQTGPTHLLQLVVDACNDALKPYSRKLLAASGDAPAFDNILPLPVELWPASAKYVLDTLEDEAKVGPVVFTLETLTGLFGQSVTISREKMRSLARALATRKISMEPDLLSIAKQPKPADLVGLFISESDPGSSSNHEVSVAYQSALRKLETCAALLHDPLPEAPYLELTKKMAEAIEGWGHLLPDHHARLTTRWVMLKKSPPTLGSLKRKVEPLPFEDREALGLFARNIVQSVALPSPAIIRQLEKLYKLLKLDTAAVYSAPLPTAVSNTPRNTVIEGSRSPLKLDSQKIASLQQDSAEVSALLAAIFEAQEPAPHASEAPKPEPEALPPVMGLDAPHSKLVRELITRPSWPASEVAGLCAQLGLMPAGALEHINEAAFDTFDMPLLEGNDPLDINNDVITQLNFFKE